MITANIIFSCRNYWSFAECKKIKKWFHKAKLILAEYNSVFNMYSEYRYKWGWL